MDNLIKEYQLWAEYVNDLLQQNQSWIPQYAKYARNMLENKEKICSAKKKFRVFSHIYPYQTIGSVTKKATQFSLRYLGQIVGTIVVDNEKVFLSVDKKTDANSKKYFDYNIGPIENEEWSKSKNAAKFRKFYRDVTAKYPRQKEHMVESALFSEMEKTKSKDKALCGITTVDFSGVRIHMKTALTACKSKDDKVDIVNAGGEIDLFCRRNIKPGESRLVVIEIKDENKKAEGFDLAIKQAISYAVFIKNLIHSNAGSDWMKLWGMEKQKTKNFTIDAVAAMPWEGESTPNFGKDIIHLKNADGTTDYIQLHYIGITDKVTPDNYDGVKFVSSFK